jgi:glyoxylate reductase/D-3-phosphoglycerate dehydrogenase
MGGNILLVAELSVGEETAREMAPSAFELTVVAPGSSEYAAALPEAEYLVGFIAGSVTETLFQAAPHLKLVQLLSAGYDRADIAAARQAGVPVANNGGANSVAVSEHAVMLMLAVSRQVVLQHANVTSGRWRGNTTPRLHELSGKTLGIVGLGNIGKKTARLGAAFGMHAQYYDIARLSEADEDALGVRFRLLREIMRTSDIVSLHMPLTETTRGLIGAEELALMKPSAIIVNTGRGPLIDEAALHQALASGAIWGAGLDVFEQEPPPADNPLFDLDNVILTPHVAGPTQESAVSRLRNAFDNVERVARGEPALWVIPELNG